jgi:hypothetical protein
MELVALADNIFYTKALLTRDLCDSILKKFSEDSRKHRGHTVNAQGERKLDDYAKISDDLEINAEGVWLEDHNKLHESVNRVVLSIANQYPALQVRPLQWSGYKIQHYKKNEGQFRWHFDAFGPGAWERQLAMVIYLNTVDEGGETCFQKQNLKVKPNAGDALFFPTFWTHMHCGETPRSNDKYVISSFVRFNFSAT